MRLCLLLLVSWFVLTALPLRAGEQPHWAYQPVVRPAIPRLAQDDWSRNAIDKFVLAKLREQQLRPSPAAQDYELLRRVTFDLTGLPATSSELAAMKSEHGPAAYEGVVDRLLASPRYGERMATHWLDLARYADTHGYHVDSHRDMWRYRDEVIASFQRHQPFDQFTIEQLAGDLLPSATLEQRIASGFNRNTLLNFEQGAIPEEYLNEYVSDRVVTTSRVWLGQTMECARCHDHKHDPISSRDFYSLYAFFNNVPELGLDGRRGNAPPLLKAPTREQQGQLTAIETRLTQLTAELHDRAAQSATAQAQWEERVRTGAVKLPRPPGDVLVYHAFDSEETAAGQKHATTGSPDWLPGKFRGALALNGHSSIVASTKPSLATKDAFTLSTWLFPTTKDAMTIASVLGDKAQRGWEVSLIEGRLQLGLRHEWPKNALTVHTQQPLATNRWQHVGIVYDGSGKAAGVQLFVDGVAVEAEIVEDKLAGKEIETQQPLVIGQGAQEHGFRGLIDEFRLYRRALTADEVQLLTQTHPISEIVALAPQQRSAAQNGLLKTHYLQQHDETYRRLQRELTSQTQSRVAILNACSTVMVMAEATEPRETFVLERGSYELPGERVTADTPAFLPPLPTNTRRDRLALARWLVDGKHPLTARVTVNRLWQLHFGQGLVRTLDDFGLHGDAPSHPELLDWLADEFVASGWNLQHIQRLIVTSATYRQSSRARDELRAADPENRWLACYPRSRFPAEMIRDQALAVSGLLVGEVGGSSVFPYQPPGLWEEVGNADQEYTAQSYTPSHGASLYRRSLYTFWKRTSPPSNLAIFDAPDRETCTVMRPISNTPLQALVLWNDPTFIESSRRLAERVLTQKTSDNAERIAFLVREVLLREPHAREQAALSHLLTRQWGVYGADSRAAEALLAVGESRRDERLDAAELAAWTIVAQAVLSTDEALSRN